MVFLKKNTVEEKKYCIHINYHRFIEFQMLELIAKF